jgi:hypothetical protein
MLAQACNADAAVSRWHHSTVLQGQQPLGLRLGCAATVVQLVSMAEARVALHACALHVGIWVLE